MLQVRGDLDPLKKPLRTENSSERGIEDFDDGCTLLPLLAVSSVTNPQSPPCIVKPRFGGEAGFPFSASWLPWCADRGSGAGVAKPVDAET